ncbi:S24/S26 family peptidase [Pseudodesulfovibrio sp. zrk46]|uniref:S24 family peptidase n=1 Tax=Pseudodesulfovibrio sp. zrk46 TaxID=2725288 RepID=UPI0014496650|nr:S24/S26 family peptidase [Pseudodesulfovibrio sp. zrk46]QJB56162.1 S24 family peptidase [Pseudodesulfovibrio sp. zrk46]
MGFTDDIRKALLERIGKGKRYPNNKRMADELGVDPSQLNRFLKKERGLNADSLGHILDRIGATITFGDEPADAARELCFRMPGKTQTDTNVPDPQADDYLAVPLAASPVAAGPGLIPEDKVEGWVLVWRHQESIRFRSNLVAVEIGRNELSMSPTLLPGDIVLVDRNDRDPSPAGKIMLVCEPGHDGGTMVKRVNTKRLDDDVELIFYSDNSREFPPTTYRLNRDYDGDITRAIGGNVVWAWSDMTKK